MATFANSGSSTQADTTAAVMEAVAAARSKIAKPTLGFLFVGSSHSMEVVQRVARAQVPGCEFIGTQTAGEITERGLTKGGVAVLLVESDSILLETSGVKGMAADPAAAAKALCVGFADLSARATAKGYALATSVVFVDALGGSGEVLVKELLANTRRYQQIVGGAAGDDGKFVTPEVAGGNVAGSDSAAIAHVFHKVAWGIGVDHGLRPMTAPMIVTKAGKSTVFELDGRPAFEAYRQYAKKRGVDLKPETAGSFLIGNELGVYFLNDLHHARAPVGVGPKGELKLVADIPENAKVCILDGEPDSMVDACTRAAAQAKDALGGNKPAAVLLFDCVCRGMILGDRFEREINSVREVFPDTPIAGFLTYGEIARFRGRLDGWHNATAVVVAIPAA